MFLWRQHTGVFVDQQYLWWHSENASPDGSCRSTSAGSATPTSTPASTRRARSTSDEEAIAAAEDVNRAFAEQCYYIPLVWLPWAVLSDPDVARHRRAHAARRQRR